MALMQLFHANNQNNLRRNRIFRDRLNPLDAYDDHELLYRYRMSRQTLMRVIDMVRDDIVHETQRSYALTPEQQTFAAIRYYATGSFQTVVGDTMGISQPSMSRIVQRVSSALCRHAGQYIRFPTTPRFQQAVKEGFMNEFTFPNVLGCVDGSLVQIKAPSTREDMYVCRGAITIELKNAIKAIIATGVLHNICEEDGVPIPEDDVPPMGRNDNGDDVNVNDHDDNAGITVRARLIRERFE
ncbi:Hypothetical predicted protein [Mytilus galloprovincialis]|uniref:Nuclease HARBI1 n=1 Tax=Mytilus galloprovincialis TaxID=29158 RepID=A0A8B6E1J8_MYTGA|nr:Hypothetical predicted protein [Mytilus galloprovincialis]